MKKRIAAAAMAVIMAVSMTGCAGKTADTKRRPPEHREARKQPGHRLAPVRRLQKSA